MLKLHPGPTLSFGTPRRGGTEDATSHVQEYLFCDVELDPAFTLGDLFRLLDLNPLLLATFRVQFVDALCAEAGKGALAPTGESWQALEYLELYQQWGYASATNEMTHVDHWHLHGVGSPLQEDRWEHGHLAYARGKRIQWGVSLTPLRELLHLPLRVSLEVPVHEEDQDSSRHMETLRQVTRPPVTLGALIQAVLWELSWHGTPQQQAAELETLQSRVADCETDPLTFVSFNNVYEALGIAPPSAVYPRFFETADPIPLDEVGEVLRTIGDTELAQPAFDLVFGGRLPLKAEFSGLSGHALRKAMRLARRD